VNAMPDTLLRTGILILLGLVTYLLVWSGRRYVGTQRRRVLTAPPASGPETPSGSVSPIRILAFGSADCSQCHQFQTPALQQVIETYGEQISVVEVDAPNQPELAQRYRVLTLPTTVLLDAAGRAHAVNYGFANSKKLLAQVNDLLQ
jgi:Thioredoxin